MGGLNSYFIRCCISSNNCPENHCKLKINHSTRSFTFNKIDENDYQEIPSNENLENISSDVVNINEAPEDIFMTLPGINRKIAHDIVVYRNKIDKFKKIEDIALVNGIGAAKFKLLKSEISLGSVRSTEVRNIYLNDSNIFQLTKIPGFSQTLAERIVSYREKNGPFRSLKDLIKVRGMNQKLLDSLKSCIQFNMINETRNCTQDSLKQQSDLDIRISDECLQFVTQFSKEFNFILTIWKIENSIESLLEKFTGTYLSSYSKPMIILLIYSESNFSLKENIHRLLNEKAGLVNYFNIIHCNVGDSCIHNNDKFKLTIFSNFEYFSKSIILSSLVEDILTCMILTIKIESHSINVIASLKSLVNAQDSSEQAQLALLNDLALKIKSGNENSFVFLCDSDLRKFADDAFQNNEFQIYKEFIDDIENSELAIIYFKRNQEGCPDLPIQMKQIRSQSIENHMPNIFDMTVLLT